MLVTGASGFIGSALIPRLAAAGHELRALARDPAKVRSAGAEVLRGDLLTGAGLSQALDHVEVAYYLIHSMESDAHSGHGDVRDSFAAREQRAAARFASAAAAAGVRRIVYLGGPLPVAAAPSAHLASRASVERLLRDAVPATVALRASIVIGAGSRSFRMLVRLVERLPVLALPAWRTHRTRPIDGRDVIEMLTLAASAPHLAGLSLDLFGPEELTYEQMLSRIAEIMLVNRPAVKLGVSMTPLAGRIVAAITEEDPSLVIPLMESLEGDLLPSDERASSLLPAPLHSFDSAVEHALAEWERIEPLAAR